MKKESYRNNESVGVYVLSNTATIEVLSIEDETIHYCLNAGERGSICKSKIYYNKDGTAYFINRLFGDQQRLRLDEVIRTNF